jgi:hypothetical protein
MNTVFYFWLNHIWKFLDKLISHKRFKDYSVYTTRCSVKSETCCMAIVYCITEEAMQLFVLMMMNF